MGPALIQRSRNVLTSGLKYPRVFVLPVGGIGPFTDSPSAITNLNLPLKVELMLSMVIGPSWILNSTPAPKPGLP